MAVAEKVCFNKTRFAGIMMFAIIVLAFLYYREQEKLETRLRKRLGMLSQETLSKKIQTLENKYREEKCPPCENSSPTIVVEAPSTPAPVSIPTPPSIPSIPAISGLSVPGLASFDPVASYDLNKLRNPLEGPTRRVPRHVIPPADFLGQIDFPTQGYPDSYQQIGLLIEDAVNGEGEGQENFSSNQILRLFGRETYPGSSRYEYYTSVANGLDQIKVPISTRRNEELYDDDVVNISALGNRSFKVQRHPMDAPRYYPHLW